MIKRIFHSYTIFCKYLLANLLAYLTILFLFSLPRVVKDLEVLIIKIIFTIIFMFILTVVLHIILYKLTRDKTITKIETRYFLIVYVLSFIENITFSSLILGIVLPIIYFLYSLIFIYLEKLLEGK